MVSTRPASTQPSSRCSRSGPPPGRPLQVPRAPDDVQRLRTILRLQRDEFLPLRVIRQELAAGRSEDHVAKPKSASKDGADPAPEARPGAALRRLTFSIAQRGAMYSLEDVVQDTGADPRLVAELAEEYSDQILHVTTRQDFQLHFVHVADTPALMRRLAAVGLTTREACGNVVRNVTACPYAGVCNEESFDVTPYANAITFFLLGHDDTHGLQVGHG